jgi:hypothetical protein
MLIAVGLVKAPAGGWGRSQLPASAQVSQKVSASDYKLQH